MVESHERRDRDDEDHKRTSLCDASAWGMVGKISTAWTTSASKSIDNRTSKWWVCDITTLAQRIIKKCGMTEGTTDVVARTKYVRTYFSVSHYERTYDTEVLENNKHLGPLRIYEYVFMPCVPCIFSLMDLRKQKTSWAKFAQPQTTCFGRRRRSFSCCPCLFVSSTIVPVQVVAECRFHWKIK